MLHDRRELIERDLRQLYTDAANMYLSIAVVGGDANSVEYQQLKDQISKLQFDLNMVNELIRQGHRLSLIHI